MPQQALMSPFLAKKMPIYRMRVKNAEQLETFMNRREDLPYKVILFTKK